MSLPNPQPRVAGIGIPLTLAELFGQMRIKGFDSAGNPQGLRVNSRNQVQFELVPGVTGSGTSKVLGQSEPSADTETTVYTVPSSTSARLEMIVAANGGSATQFDIGVAVGGGSLAGEDFLFENSPIRKGQTMVFSCPMTLSATDVIRARSSSGAVVFSVWGVEWA